MGMAARAVTPPARAARRVRTPAHAPARRARSTSETRYRDAFRGAFAIMLLLTVVGLVRVSVAASSAEAALDSGRIRNEITEARRLGARLEVDRSALAMPSRIEGIASESLEMAEPVDVDYIAVEPKPAAGEGAAPSPGATARAGQEVPGALSALLRFAAGEAQALLVGDVGLASAR